MRRNSRKHDDAAPGRAEQAAMDRVRAAQRALADVERRRDDAVAAAAATRSALAWIAEAARAVEDGTAQFGDPVFGLTHHAAGAREKQAALRLTLANLEQSLASLAVEGDAAQAAVAEARARLAVRRRRSGQISAAE